MPSETPRLRVRYAKPVHLDVRKVTADGVFRIVSPERLANRYERT